MSIWLPIPAYAARVNETCFVYTLPLAAGYLIGEKIKVTLLPIVA